MKNYKTEQSDNNRTIKCLILKKFQVLLKLKVNIKNDK